MWIDESDTTQLSQRLRVGPRELLESIGGPWQVVERFSEHEMERPGTLFVGHVGTFTSYVGQGFSVVYEGHQIPVTPERVGS